MNYNSLISQCLVTLRGKHSQMKISKKLGYSFNQVSRWETCRTKINWRDFIRFCSVCNVSLEKAFYKYFRYDSQLDDGKLLFLHFIRGESKKSIAQKINCSSSTLSKIISGTKQPSTETVFKLINKTTISLPELIQFFLGNGSKISEINDVITSKNSLREIYYDNPFLQIVVEVLHTKEYLSYEKHKKGIIANLLSISLSEEEEILNHLEKKQIIKFVKDKYVPQKLNINMEKNFHRLIDVKKFWLEKQINMLSVVQRDGGYSDGAIAGYGVFSVNEKSFKKIEALYRDFFQSLINIVLSNENNEELTRIICYNCHLTDILENISISNKYEL